MRRGIKVLQYCYTILFYCALPLLLLRHKRKAKQATIAKGRLHERLGQSPILDQCIWLHAVSVGETIAAVPLVKALIAKYPTTPILLTTTTATGSEQVHKLLGNKVHHVFLPYDLPLLIKRFMKRSKPKLLIIMETELWPNLLTECKKRNLPTMLANARLSNKSFQNYKKIAKSTRYMLNQFSIVAAQSQEDAENFLQLGLTKEKLLMSGNLKFDLKISDAIKTKGKQIKQAIGARPIFIAASTHEGEEKIILSAFELLIKEKPDCLLILVPRNPERFQKVEKLCQQQKLNTLCRSSEKLPQSTTQVFLIDKMGELLLFYAASDIAFVGGSLVPVGGHNMIEPAVFGLPILTGPYLGNFLAISKLLQQAQAMHIASDDASIATQVCELLNDKTRCQQIGSRAKAVVSANVGALDRHMDWINRNHDLPIN